MEGRLLARARAKQETLRAENRAEEDRRRREIAAKIPEIGRIDTALCANLSEMVRIAMRQSARTAQELEKESLALQEKAFGASRAERIPEGLSRPHLFLPALPGYRLDGREDLRVRPKALPRRADQRARAPFEAGGRDV